MKRYVLVWATHSHAIWESTDERAIRVFDRWIRLFWHRWVFYLREKCRGSIAHAAAEGWYGKDIIGEVWHTPTNDIGVVLCTDARLVHTVKLPKIE